MVKQFGRSSFQTRAFPALVFYTCRLFFHFGRISSTAAKGWKESIGFLDAELYAESFGKKIH